MNARDPAFVPLSRSARLRRLLVGDELEFLMEAHNGLSARIVREAGFAGIWASGLAISAQFGVRDNNEASWTQVVDTLASAMNSSSAASPASASRTSSSRRPTASSAASASRSRTSTSSAARSRPGRARRPTNTSRSSRASRH